jgi:23S rRNA pseudouridine1911/1915/1917 synthase
MFGEKRKYVVTEQQAGMRLDQVLQFFEPDLSRQYLQYLIRENRVKAGQKQLKPSSRIKAGQSIAVDYPEMKKLDLEPANLPLKIVYEDDNLLVVDKDAGMPVHPGPQGQFIDSSLVNALLAHVGDRLKGIGGVLRPGIVHRLDKDTSGLMVVAKTEQAHRELSKMFKEREVEKYYLAMVEGDFMQDHGIIEAPIGRSTANRKLMAVNGLRAREAKTEFWVEKRYILAGKSYVLLKIRLHSGRTHQIRVHMAFTGHRLLGDRQYGSPRLNKIFEQKFGLKRQFLHACRISFIHPDTRKKLDLQSDLPADLKQVIDCLNQEV